MARGTVKVRSVNGALTVTFTTASGRTPTVYSDSALTTTQTLPATVADGATGTFYFASPGAYTMSVKTASGIQIAADLNTTRVINVDHGQTTAYDYDTRLVSKDASGDSGRHSPGKDLSATYKAIVKLVGTAATDTANIQAAIDAGGLIFLDGASGTFTVNQLLIKSGAHLDLGGCTLQLAAGANVDLITVPNFGTLTGTNSSGGEVRWSIRNGILDGNGTNQSGTSWTFRVYGHNYRISNVEMINGLSGNAASEWYNAGGGDIIESFWRDVKLVNPIANGAVNLDWQGPHDGMFSDMAVVANGSAGPSGVTGQVGIRTYGNAANELFTNVHVWGFHQYGWKLERGANAYNSIAEGAYATNLMLLSNNITFQGQVFGTSGTHPNEIGVQVGDGSHINIRQCRIDINTYGWASGAFPLSWVSTAGTNRFRGVVTYTGATALSTGSPHARDDLSFISLDGATIDTDTELIGHPVNIRAASNTAFKVGSFSYNNNSQHSDLISGGTHRGWKDSFGTQTFEVDSANGSFRAGSTAGMGARIFSCTGAPTFSATAGDFCFRYDTPSTANQRLYVNTSAGSGTTWTAIL